MSPYEVITIAQAHAMIAQLESPPYWLRKAWAQRASEHKAIIAGANVSYRAWNQHRDDLPAMILVYGFMAHTRWWDHIAPFLMEQYRVIALDFCGMGDSDYRQTYSRELFAQEILGVIDHANLVTANSKPIVVAHSFGGTAAAVACQLAPDKIGRIILVDATLQLAEQEYEAPTHAKKYYPSEQEALARFRLLPAGKSQNPFILDYIARHALKKTDQGWTWKFDDQMGKDLNQDTSLDLSDFKVPMDLIYGEKSEYVSAATAQRIQDTVTTCNKSIAIPMAMHHILLDQPLALISAIRAVLR